VRHSLEHRQKISKSVRETMLRKQERIRLALRVLDQLEANGIVVLDQRAAAKGIVALGRTQ
jgi:hypothetical protein